MPADQCGVETAYKSKQDLQEANKEKTGEYQTTFSFTG